jgi:ligand-binding sensor domain-containing protein
MKSTVKILFSLLGILSLAACEKNADNTYRSYLDYLADKAIHSIRIVNDTIWISSSSVCDTCMMFTGMPYEPRISQLTMIKGDSFEFAVQNMFEFPLVQDSKGFLYTSRNEKISRIDDLQHFETILETDDYYFNYLAFDQSNNIWLCGYSGLAFWDKTNLTFYNVSNSGLPTNIGNGVVADDNNVWIPLDQYGVLKITGTDWSYIPYADIPGLKADSYLNNPLLDAGNNLWFEVFRSDTTSSILRFDGENWHYEFPNAAGSGWLNVDSEGTVWAIYNELKDEKFQKTILSYRQNNEWLNFDVTRIKRPILTVNADEEYVYIGTVNGLIRTKK